MNKKLFYFPHIVTIIFLVSSCSSKLPSETTPEDVEVSVQLLSTKTAIPISSVTENATNTPHISENPPVPTPTFESSLIGTPLPSSSTAISASNVNSLQKVAQWGRGSILGVGFTPDGNSFIAVSELGWSIYDRNDLTQPPLWVPFQEPILFDEFYFSSDGRMVEFIRFDYQNTVKYFLDFPNAIENKPANDVIWEKPNVTKKYSDIASKSPDGTKLFRSGLNYEYNEELFSEENSFREMYDDQGKLLYSLRDDAPYVSYSDRNGPEGCDLSVFSPCGNALMSVATVPSKVLFSSDSHTFTALYEPPSLYFGIMKAFSYIRVYESKNGDLIGSIGGFTKPVQDFSYSPDGKLLVVGFVDGSIVLWDVENAATISGSRHMNAPIWKVEYSQDSKYLLIQREEEVEVRLSANGSLIYRFDAVEFAVSPVENLMALGDSKGNINIRNLDSGKTERQIEAHQDKIYSLAFSPDGFYIASAGQDCDIKLWDLNTGKLLHYFEETRVDPYEIEMSSRIFSTYLEFVPNQNMLIGFGSWGTVVNWNVNSGETNYTIQSSALEYYNGMITVKPHFPEFFSVDAVDENFYINENGFDLITGESLGVYQPPLNLPVGCSPVGPITIDGEIMFTRGYDTLEGKICILEKDTLNLLGEIQVMPESVNYTQWIDWLYLSPDGRQLIVTIGSGVVYVYQIVQ